MNYLGHLLVLPDAGLVTLGNLLGDFVKGRPEFIEPREFQLGVRLHRELDRFTDAHPAVLRSKQLVAEERRRVAGVLVDLFYDHFLAQNLDLEGMRESLEPHAAALPEALRELPGRMVSSRWFGAYRHLDGIAAVLQRMDERRARPLGLSGAAIELERHYEALRADAEEFFPEARVFTKEALLRLQSAYPEAHPPGEAAAVALDLPQTSAGDPSRTR